MIGVKRKERKECYSCDSLSIYPKHIDGMQAVEKW